MAGKGGGAWKVAYADFVTAMMAFFLVMWITAQNKPVKESVARYFEDPFGTTEGSAATPLAAPEGVVTVGPNDTNWGLARGSAKVPSEDESEMHEAAHRHPTRPVIFDLGDETRAGVMLLFADDSAALDEAARSQLTALLPDLLGKPNIIEIRGHTSRRPVPAAARFQDARQLSYARCVATMEFLTARGVDPDRVRLSQSGASEPYTLRRDPRWQQRNERVEVYVLSEFADERERKRDAANADLPE